MANELTRISGIGITTAEILAEHGYKTIASIAKTSKQALAEIPGFSVNRAEKIIADAQALQSTALTTIPKTEKTRQTSHAAKTKKSKAAITEAEQNPPPELIKEKTEKPKKDKQKSNKDKKSKKDKGKGKGKDKTKNKDKKNKKGKGKGKGKGKKNKGKRGKK